MSQFELRPANPGDFDFLKRLHFLTMKEYVAQIWGWDEKQQEQLLRDRFDPSKLQVIRIASRDAGVLQVEARSGEFYLDKIYLLPEFQGNGYGSAIVQSIQDKAAAQNCAVTLSVLKPNPARQLYERLGFQVTGEDDFRYFMAIQPS